MIIDLILDRRAGEEYSTREFYKYLQGYGQVFGKMAWDIVSAMDEGIELYVKEALCKYIIDQGYNENICEYINSVNWLDTEFQMKIFYGTD